jgi:thymidylate kinase
VEGSPAHKQWWLGLKVRRCLRGCARYTYFGRLRAYAGVIAIKLRRVADGNIKNKVLDSGGAVVAFVGGDATGKSTLIAETSRWLGGSLAVRKVHVGKPPAIWLTAPLRVLLPLARRLFPSQRHQARQAADAAQREREASFRKEASNSTSLVYAARAVSLAWERSRLLRRVHRHAAEGEIVICDRYPSDRAGATDGPRLRVRDGKRGWRARLFNRLARYEQRLYARNAPPDIVLRLNVSLETAKRRNRQRTKVDRHSDEDLEIRHQKCRAWRNAGTKVVHDIDTEASLAETILSVKKTIWSSL